MLGCLLLNTFVYNRRREPRVYPWVNPSKIFDEVARRFGGNLRFQSTTALAVGIYNFKSGCRS